VLWPLIIGANWIAFWNIPSSGRGVITGREVCICKYITVDWPNTTLSECSPNSGALKALLSYIHVMFNKLVPRNLFQILLHVIVTSLDPGSCKGAKDTNIKRLELVGGMWGE
jgi:hypothetical protein